MLYNKTRKERLSETVEFADSFWKKLRGLMFSGKKGFPLVFVFPGETRLKASVHNLFVFYAIDLFYLDGKKRVVDVKKNFKPFSLNYTPKKKAKYLIEAPSGMLKGIELNHEIGFSEKKINEVDS